MYNAPHKMSKASANGTIPLKRISLLDSLSSENQNELDRKRLLINGTVVFTVALVVRFICWYYAGSEALKIQSGVSANYKILARLFVEEGLLRFYSPQSGMSNLNLMGHPPGYPLFLAFIYKVFGESNVALQFVQIAADALSVVIIMLIATELLSPRIALIAGFLAALSPQFSWNSILILPDALSVLPILLAVYLLVRWRKDPRGRYMFAAGLLLGVATLLRANNLLLAPFLAALIVIRMLPSRGQVVLPIQKRLRFALILVAGTVLVIAPITIRHAIVYRHFIPVSLGAGQTLLEGIADYDQSRRFNIPETDTGIAEQEAKQSGRPDYADSLFGPDGIQRDRTRTAHGLRVIVSNPIWFSGVMVQRAISMFKFERVPIISVDPNHTLAYPTILKTVQRFFLSVWMVPLILFGLALLVLARRWAALAFLSIVPVYYLVFQSPLHTESRYLIAMNYFLVVFAAVAIVSIVDASLRMLTLFRK